MVDIARGLIRHYPKLFTGTSTISPGGKSSDHVAASTDEEKERGTVIIIIVDDRGVPGKVAPALTGAEPTRTAT